MMIIIMILKQDLQTRFIEPVAPIPLPLGALLTVCFHDFKSQNFKLSVSNPKSKYVAYLSVLSQISNRQGLGRKNKHLKI